MFTLLPAQGPLLPCCVQLRDLNSSPYDGLRSSQLLLLLEMKGWRQPAWTSRAGVTAFLAKPRAWPALLKPWEGSSLATQCLPLPQGFMKSSLCCGVTCEGQDVGMEGGMLHCGHKIAEGMHSVESRSHGHQLCCCFCFCLAREWSPVGSHCNDFYHTWMLILESQEHVMHPLPCPRGVLLTNPFWHPLLS